MRRIKKGSIVLGIVLRMAEGGKGEVAKRKTVDGEVDAGGAKQAAMPYDAVGVSLEQR